MRINQSVKRRAKMMIRDAKEKDIPRILELLKQVLQIHARSEERRVGKEC